MDVAMVIGRLLAQSALSQLGLTEAAARELMLGDLRTGGRDAAVGRLAVAGRAAYQRVPEAARGPVTTDLFAWAKAFANSPAVKAAYPGYRAAAMPERKKRTLTVDEEMKKQYDDLVATNDRSRQMAASLPPADRDKLLANLKAMEDYWRSPEGQQAARASIEATRGPEAAKEDAAMKDWEERFPADIQVFIARRLREFLAATADVDFEARTKTIRGINGAVVGFVTPPDYDTKPFQWRDAFVVGPAATAAARAAAESWLKEIAP